MSDEPIKSRMLDLTNLPASVRLLNPHLFGPPKPDPVEMYKSDTKADMHAEKHLQRLCEQYLSRRGVWYLHLSFRARERAGCPDLLFCINGIPHAIELKSRTGRLSDEQKTTLEQMAANGWKTAVCRSYEQFVEVIRDPDITMTTPTGQFTVDRRGHASIANAEREVRT